MSDKEFEHSAQYYDALYAHLETEREVEFALRRLRRIKPDLKSVLDLGCGTGRHAVEFARQGLRVVGIDRSPDMLKVAALRQGSEGVEYIQANIETFDLGRQLDSAICLFHVFGYLPTLEFAFARVREHIVPNGAFLFDGWNADAVKNNPPRPVERVVETSEGAIKRVTTPVIHEREGFVDIKFDFQFAPKSGAPVEEFSEVHRMRFFEDRKVRESLERNGFEVIEVGKWLSGQTLDRDTWSAYWLAKRR